MKVNSSLVLQDGAQVQGCIDTWKETQEMKLSHIYI